MAGEPLFDVNTFLEQQHKGGIDTTYVLPPERDYRAQTTDKIASNSGIVTKGDYAGNAWANITLMWDLMDDEVKRSLNQEHVLVRQSVMLDLDQEEWRSKHIVKLDWGTNRNMRLKRLLDATGLNSMKNFNLNMLKHQMAYVTVAHNKPDGFEDSIAEVTRVVNISRAPS